MTPQYAPGVQPGGRILTRRWPRDEGSVVSFEAPRDDLVLERRAGDGSFEQAEGPFDSYRRTVRDDGAELVERTEYRLTVPWFGWLFGPPVRAVLARRISHRGWWAPPDRLDATQVLVLGLLAAAAMNAAFVNTLFTQTVNFAADEFGVDDTGIGVAGAIVRAGILLALPAAVLADRLGRRRLIVWTAWLGPVLSLIGAIAPSFSVLVITQTFARPMGIALAFLVGVVAAEEVPRNSRAYAVSVLAMASGFGAGIAVLSLRFADIGDGGWRLVYVISIIWCVIALDLTRRLPETRRFTVAHAHAGRTSWRPPRIDRKRLLLLCAVALAGNIFIAPASFFQNRYLTDIRDFSGGMIGIFSIAVGTPAGLGLIIGGRIADTSGRRRLIAVAIPVSTALLVGAYTVGGRALWMSALFGGMIASAAYPALAVYRAELFPTGNRSRATGIISAAALLGGIGGLLATGWLLDAHWSYGSVMGTMAVGQLVVVVLVLAFYPETAHHELEDLNPEDEPLDLPGL